MNYCYKSSWHNPTDRGGVGVDGDPPGGELLDVVAAGGGQAWVQPVELLPVLVPLDAVNLRNATLFVYVSFLYLKNQPVDFDSWRSDTS